MRKVLSVVGIELFIILISGIVSLITEYMGMFIFHSEISILSMIIKVGITFAAINITSIVMIHKIQSKEIQ